MAARPSQRLDGFTLIELLVVVAIIALLIAILLPSLSKAREQTKRLACASNIRQLDVACTMHAQEHAAGVYITAVDTGQDSFAHIFPRYLPNADLTICPATKNVIRKNQWVPPSKYGYPVRVLKDLTYGARNREDNKGGHSYEIWGWYDGLIKYPDGKIINGNAMGTKGSQLGIRPTDPLYATNYNNLPYGCVVKKHSQVRQPATTILVLDNDQADPGVNNWPDQLDNHAPFGLNIGFLDGHVQWYNANIGGKFNAAIVRCYLRSYNTPPDNWKQADPNLRQKTEKLGQDDMTVYYYAP
jgi:prepilin-type N-terminal cleavage/methylation domain-containing protein/prepilin-type processing-associated H-X9-DG protein